MSYFLLVHNHHVDVEPPGTRQVIEGSLQFSQPFGASSKQLGAFDHPPLSGSAVPLREPLGIQRVGGVIRNLGWGRQTPDEGIFDESPGTNRNGGEPK